ncbi:MAG: adenylate/guanylate cyclase domain-containing protein [Synechococcus lacustris]
MTVFSKLGIQSKLLALVLAVSLFTLLLTGFVSYSSSRQALMAAADAQLVGLRNSRAQAIESYFKGLKAHALTLGYQQMAVNAINSLGPAINSLNSSQITAEQAERLRNFYAKDFLPKLKKNIEGDPALATYLPISAADKYLTYHYTVANPYPKNRAQLLKAGDGSEYSELHGAVHKRFRVIAEEFGYPDLYLIDAKGNVLYSVAKKIDFGGNITDGPFAGSSLDKAFEMARQSRDPDFVGITDFENYKPGYGVPSAFVSTTVFDKDKFIGVLVLEVPSQRIDQIMNVDKRWQQVGLGESGETYLVGPDQRMRSSSRFLFQDPKGYYKALEAQGVAAKQLGLIKSAQSSILIQQVKSKGALAALAGKAGLASYNDYRGVAVLGAYAPIKLGDFDWALVAEIDQAEIFSGVHTLTRNMLITAAIMMPLITLVSGAVAKTFLTPIRRLIAGTHEIERGNSEVQIPVGSQDEFGELTQSFNAMAKALHGKEQAIQAHMQENDRLLLTILPPGAAERLKSGEQDISDSFPNVTVLYVNVDGVDSLSASLSEGHAYQLLNQLNEAFDEAAERFSVEKIRSMGSIYVAVCGLSIPRVDHAKRMVDFALAMINIIRRFNRKEGLNLGLDIGIHSGPVSAGVVGKTRFNYEVWGETMNIAKQIHESPGQNQIHVSQSVYEALQGLYSFEPVAEQGNAELPIWRVS